MIDTNVKTYAKRGQSDRNKIQDQIITGKLGELAVHRLLGTPEPDFTVYQGKKKSFGEDLALNSFKLHVKTQDAKSAAKYGTSWTFQFGGAGFGHVDKLLVSSTPQDIAVFMLIDRISLIVSIEHLVKCTELTKILSLPKLIQLFGSKRVVYSESVKPEHCISIEELTKEPVA